MRDVKFDCPIELVTTDWQYVCSHDKVSRKGYTFDVHEYRCRNCNRATIYLSNTELQRLIRTSKLEEGVINGRE